MPCGRTRVEAVNENGRRLAAWGCLLDYSVRTREQGESERDRPHDWGGNFRAALGVAAAAAAATTMGGRTESERAAVGPGMIPAVSIYMRARGAHNLLAVCSSCAVQRGARHRSTRLSRYRVWAGWLVGRLVGWLAGYFSLRFSCELRTRIHLCTAHT